VWCWGANYIGQLGDTTTTARLSPINVNGLGTVAHIGAGEEHTCALTTAGEIWCWGRNNNGQIGNGTTSATATPTKVITSGATDLVVGASQTCAKIGADWSCWGRNDRAQLANGTQVDVLVPTPIASFGNAMNVAVGSSAGCKLAADGVSCTGVTGTLGTGDNAESFPRAPALPGCQ
jgi:alpha-tubulin suppressor-like RCC1 family protein